MKKRYEMPEIQVVKINTTTLLAGSPDAYVDPSQSVNPGEVESRRGCHDWDDEDDF